MALKDKLPTFEKGSPDLGSQLRELLAVVVEACDAIELLKEPLALAPSAEGDEVKPEGNQEAPDATPSEPAEAEAPAADKPAPKAATRASGK